MFSILFYSQRAVLRDSFRFPEINLAGFCRFNSEGRAFDPLRNPLGGGHLTKERALMVGNLTKKNKKCQMPGGQPGGGDGHSWI